MEISMILLGIVIGYVIAKMTSTKPSETNINIDSNYVQKSLYAELQKENREKGQEITNLSGNLSTYKEKALNLERKLEEHKGEFDEIKNKLALEFKVLSNKIFEEKSEKFLALNQKNVSDILNPLKDKIKEFETKVDKNHLDEKLEKATLKEELKQIIQLNKQVSEDATRLTNALKGDKKLQGNWGEIQLEMILIKAGLTKGIHFTSQATFESEDGKSLRPDFVLNLPDKKNLVLDSKVSLVAYEQYFNEENEALKQNHLKNHLGNINKHISDLSAKNYQKLYNIDSPDYVLMFVPLEPALFAALQGDNKIFEKALEKNIVLVSTSTLLATLRTISYIWKQDRLSNNHLEIAYESGLLYDKFVGFTEDLINVGKKLDGVKSDYSDAMNKLTDSKQKGATIIGRMEKIKELGAKTTKSITPSLLNRIDNNTSEEAAKTKKKGPAPDNLFDVEFTEQ
jgi:DNA recombination protein RmuC